VGAVKNPTLKKNADGKERIADIAGINDSGVGYGYQAAVVNCGVFIPFITVASSTIPAVYQPGILTIKLESGK
jgi:hypothetical protein